MEKRGVIQRGITPPGDDPAKLEEHLTKRAADKITEKRVSLNCHCGEKRGGQVVGVTNAPQSALDEKSQN